MDLNSSVADLPKVGPILSRKLKKLGIDTIKDLFFHVPTRYLDYANVTTISKLTPGDTATIHANIISIKNIYSRKGLKMQIGSVEDATGKVSVIWFNQPYLIKTLYPGRLVSLSGKVNFFSRKLCLSNPDYEILDTENDSTLHTGRLVPIYSETSGLSSKWIRRLIQNGITNKELRIKDDLDPKTLEKYNLEGLEKAIKYVHFPENLKEAEVGRKRLAFDELLNLQLQSELRKKNWKKQKIANKLKIDTHLTNEFIKSLPFKLTESQKKAADEILTDMKADVPMNRLLEGDVGSGKTAVAAIGAFAAFSNGFQSVIMAPTQILAEQHYITLGKLFKNYKIRISLITSSSKKIEIGRSDIFIGTHALIQSKKINLEKIAFVVIDEQHRFGVEQRNLLIKKSGTPHVLTMTATPIPRTVALTTYGDLEFSVLTEMPTGRQKITTWVVPEQKRPKAYEWIRSQISKFKSQIFIVCPLIEESLVETMKDIKAVASEFKKLKIEFKNFKLGLLHGRLKADEKNRVLSDFGNKKIDILVATPVVEVGIDIPNATIMVIEAAERFGLAQLHQLRGRVGRGEKKSYCLLFSNFHSGNSYKRLKAMERNLSGFELAELDLKMRGPGEIFGTQQSGFPELKIASWSNYELIKQTKELAKLLIAPKANFSVQ